jgi:hypothetical protein
MKEGVLSEEREQIRRANDGCDGQIATTPRDHNVIVINKK